ncbi:hypothetical protein DFH11DRAFT_1070480 [Phellopilus nigrolimitatus]|nr:hypothetical protein DFH11DRAFT_1070480 [Phellopilus nigrolimitatus]
MSNFCSGDNDGTQQLATKGLHGYSSPFRSLLDAAIDIVSQGSSSKASVEMKIFQTVQGHQGIPNILNLGGFIIPRPMCISSDLKDVQVCNGYYETRNKLTCKSVIEPRVQNYWIISTKGESLIGAKPYDIARAALDGIIGHFNLFLIGYLHQDVSYDSIYKMPKAVQRSRDDIQKTNICFSHPKLQKTSKFNFLLEHMSECSGFIVDGDQAVEWRKGREAGRHRSGTLPFMSYRITRGWILDEFILHTAIDDLESFAWVVLWCALHKLENPSKLEALWIERLTADELRHVLGGKISIIFDLSKKSAIRTLTFSKPLVLLLPLVSKWLSVAREAAERLDTFLRDFVEDSPHETLEDVITDSVFANEENGLYDQLKDMCIGVYAEYLQAGVGFLKSRMERPTAKPTA